MVLPAAGAANLFILSTYIFQTDHTSLLLSFRICKQNKSLHEQKKIKLPGNGFPSISQKPNSIMFCWRLNACIRVPLSFRLKKYTDNIIDSKRFTCWLWGFPAGGPSEFLSILLLSENLGYMVKIHIIT